MKISVLILSLVLFSVVTQSVYGQNPTINTEESSIILSEATITSIANLFSKYKKEHPGIYIIEEDRKANSKLYLKHDSLLELSSLQQDEALKIKNTKVNTAQLNKKATPLTDNIRIESHRANASKLYANESSLELSSLRREIETLKNIIMNQNSAQLNKDFDKNASSDALKRDLSNLEYEMAELRTKMNYKSTIPHNTAVIVSKSKTDKNENVQELTVLQKQLDSLFVISYAKTEIIKDSTDYADEFSSLQLKLQELQANIASNNTNQTNYGILKSQFKDYYKQIFFANNSVSLQLEASKVMQEVYSVLEKYENIDVLIKGYASNKGLPSINEKLSMQRTETVKKGLVLKGIHPSRILTQYHGIDYDTTSENDARRVDITLVIRK